MEIQEKEAAAPIMSDSDFSAMAEKEDAAEGEATTTTEKMENRSTERADETAPAPKP